MFENIIGQASTVATIRSELTEGRFPRAVLFCGPAYSAKLSTALETARVLTCTAKAEWSCECSSCRAHRTVSYPYLLLMGSRYFGVEIAACADVLCRAKSRSSQYLFVRAVRKLTRRFEPILWEGEETKWRQAQNQLAGIEENLDSVAPERSPPDERTLEKRTEGIRALCTKLSSAISADNIPINHVRRASQWAHISASGSRKIIIIENADKMQDSSRNSLLKILEEPPAGVSLILLTTRRSALIPTVASRLRPYVFFERDRVQTQEILQRIFAEDPASYGTLREYFLAWKDLNPTVLRHHALRLGELALAGNRDGTDIVAEMNEILSTGSPRESLISLLEELLIVLESVLGGHMVFKSEIPLETVEDWGDAVREQLLGLNLYNMNPTLVLENLFARMRGKA